MGNTPTVLRWLRPLRAFSRPALRRKADNSTLQADAQVLDIPVTEPTAQIETPSDDNSGLRPESVKEVQSAVRALSPAETESTIDTDYDADVEHLVKALSKGLGWMSESTRNPNVSQIKG